MPLDQKRSLSSLIQHFMSYHPKGACSPLGNMPPFYMEFCMFFEKTFNIRSKESIADFLAKHRRYDTMNSWNRSTSYAHCVKFSHLGFTGTQLEKAYDVSAADDYWDLIRFPADVFNQESGGTYSIGRNGRSAGYLVLMESEIYDPGYKSTCPKCGQLNYQVVSESSHQCGVCHAERRNLKSPLQWTRTLNRSIDHGMNVQDYLEQDFSWLKERAELVRSFDRVCDQIRSNFIDVLNEFMIVEKTIMVPQIVRSLERV